MGIYQDFEFLTTLMTLVLENWHLFYLQATRIPMAAKYGMATS
jgi:hypothetical protein